MLLNIEDLVLSEALSILDQEEFAADIEPKGSDLHAPSVGRARGNAPHHFGCVLYVCF